MSVNAKIYKCNNCKGPIGGKIIYSCSESECQRPFCAKCLNDDSKDSIVVCKAPNGKTCIRCPSHYGNWTQSLQMNLTLMRMLKTTGHRARNYVKCPNTGCDFEDHQLELTEHIKSCKYTLMPCIFGCEQKIAVSDQWGSHIDKTSDSCCTAAIAIIKPSNTLNFDKLDPNSHNIMLQYPAMYNRGYNRILIISPDLSGGYKMSCIQKDKPEFDEIIITHTKVVTADIKTTIRMDLYINTYKDLINGTLKFCNISSELLKELSGETSITGFKDEFYKGCHVIIDYSDYDDREGQVINVRYSPTLSILVEGDKFPTTPYRDWIAVNALNDYGKPLVQRVEKVEFHRANGLVEQHFFPPGYCDGLLAQTDEGDNEGDEGDNDNYDGGDSDN
jgi:hypothetical protein